MRPRLRRFARLLTVAALVVPARAGAAEPDAETPPSRWYGYQTLAADAVGIGAFSAGVGIGIKEHKVAAWSLIAGGALVYGLGAFTVHLLHGQTQHAKLGGTVRAITPWVGFLIPILLFGIGDRKGDDAGAPTRATATYAILGAGILAPVVVDAAIAFEPIPGSREAIPLWRTLSVAPVSGGATVGMTRAF
ncbi:MAG: hypothetical protein KF819_07920 [Labilithrix sp.]|nr:hypothetical protein [Labilithrix sp.]